MKTLFLTQRFPPHTGAAARRLTHLGQSFAARGALFVVRAGGVGEELPFVEKTVAIVSQDLRRLTGKSSATLDTAVKERWLVRFLLRLRQAYPFVYLADDGGADYRQKAFAEACQLVEAEGITTVFSSFRPWSDHLVARRLKHKYPQLKWIADFRDLPVDSVRRDVWFPALQRWWGKRVVRSADELWAVSEGQKAQFSGWHPRIVVRRNALLALPPPTTAPVTERFTITYTGSLYPGLQTVRPLVSTLKELLASGAIPANKLCLQYRGKDAATFRQWTVELPPHCLDVEPSIAPAAAQKMQHNATVLLLLNWSAPGYYGVLTAKLWDYLATGRPVLALVNGPGDKELKDIVEGAAAGAVYGFEEQGELHQWLGKAYANWESTGTLPWRVNHEALRQLMAATNLP